MVLASAVMLWISAHSLSSEMNLQACECMRTRHIFRNSLILWSFTWCCC